MSMAISLAMAVSPGTSPSQARGTCLIFRITRQKHTGPVNEFDASRYGAASSETAFLRNRMAPALIPCFV